MMEDEKNCFEAISEWNLRVYLTYLTHHIPKYLQVIQGHPRVSPSTVPGGSTHAVASRRHEPRRGPDDGLIR